MVKFGFFKLMCRIRSFFLVFFLFWSLQTFSVVTARTLHFYNWTDYISPQVLTDFEKQTGINIVYDVFDSNEMLDGKLMAGNTGFDLVMPSDNFLARQIHYSIYQRIDKSRLSNYKNLDPRFLKLMQVYDPGNLYGVPFMWQTTGIGINVTKVREILGKDVPLDSWDLLFKKENIKKLYSCGVAFLDAPTEIYPTVFKYLGIDPLHAIAADYDRATQLLMKIRPYITYFHSSKYINDLASGDICIAIGWSGDILQAERAAENAKAKYKIEYIIPKEGALISFDLLSIPKDAKNVDEAYQFINYLLRPEVIAKVTNHIFYPNANRLSKPFLRADIANNKAIYLPQATLKRLFSVRELSADQTKQLTRDWTRIMTGY